MNSVNVTGRLTKDPDIRYNGEMCFADFSIAIQRRFKNKETGEYDTDFFEVKAFGKTAEMIEKYFSKGKRIEIEGRLQQDRWQDKETGKGRSKTYIVADSIGFGESKAESDKNQGGEKKQSQSATQQKKPDPMNDDFLNATPDIEEELPFN